MTAKNIDKYISKYDQNTKEKLLILRKIINENALLLWQLKQ